MSTEIRVGLFVIIALAVLTFFLVRIGEWPFFGGQDGQYRVAAKFNNVVGLNRGADVVLSGVRIGQVEDIRLDGQKALVIMAIDDGVDFPANSVARIASVGLLGQAIVEVAPLEEGGGITARQSKEIGSLNPVTIDQLVTVIKEIGDDVTEVTTSIKDFLGVEGGTERMQAIMENLANFSEGLNSLVQDNRARLDSTLISFDELAAESRDKLPKLLDQITALSDDIKKALDENRDSFDETAKNARSLSEKLDRAADTIQAILDKIERGEGSIGKLINEPETLEKAQDLMGRMDSLVSDIQEFVSKPSSITFNYGFRTDFFARSDDFIYRFRLNTNFSKRDSFIFELINDQVRNKPPAYRPGDRSGNALDLGDEFTISLLYGRRFRGGRISFGLMENNTGVGLQLGEDDQRLRFRIEGLDFGREDGPHVRVASFLNLYKGLFMTIGYDDVLDKQRGQLFFGGGYQF